MKSIYLDTNMLISLLDPVDPAFMSIIYHIKQGGDVMTNSIAWHEFIRGPLTEQDRMRVRKILQGQIHVCSETDAEIAAHLYNETGRQRSSTPDCLIAATALRLKVPLFTRNLRDFEPFEIYGLELYR